MVGNTIDRSSSRLGPMISSISCNRLSIVIACFVWSPLLHQLGTHNDVHEAGHDNQSYNTVTRITLFTIVIAIGIIERLSGIASMLSMERDWVPTLALAAIGTHDEAELTQLNAVMRRIDLVCKLLSPLVISGFIEATSTLSGVILVGTLSGICWPIEVLLARHVWSSNRRLRERKDLPVKPQEDADSKPLLVKSITSTYRAQLRQVRQYLAADVWPASFALSLLHLSALSYAATFITFMLNEGFSLLVITIARALGSVVEVSSTFVAPSGIRRLAHCRGCPAAAAEAAAGDAGIQEPEEASMKGQHDIGLARSGLWGLTLQFTCLIPVVLAVFQISKDLSYRAVIPGSTSSLSSLTPNSIGSITALAAITLFLPLSFSRLGLWVFDLTTQELAQTHVPPAQRSSFAGTETALASLFELLQWLAAAVWNKPEDFRWLALGSLGAVGTSLVIYSGWVRRRRGHLVHWRRLSTIWHSCTKA